MRAAHRGVALYAPAGSHIAQQPDKPRGLSDKSSIAVLPFANLSGDPEQEYVSDGMVGEIVRNVLRRSVEVTGEKRTWQRRRLESGFDPERTLDTKNRRPFG